MLVCVGPLPKNGRRGRKLLHKSELGKGKGLCVSVGGGGGGGGGLLWSGVWRQLFPFSIEDVAVSSEGAFFLHSLLQFFCSHTVLSHDHWKRAHIKQFRQTGKVEARNSINRLDRTSEEGDERGISSGEQFCNWGKFKGGGGRRFNPMKEEEKKVSKSGRSCYLDPSESSSRREGGEKIFPTSRKKEKVKKCIFSSFP